MSPCLSFPTCNTDNKQEVATIFDNTVDHVVVSNVPSNCSIFFLPFFFFQKTKPTKLHCFHAQCVGGEAQTAWHQGWCRGSLRGCGARGSSTRFRRPTRPAGGGRGRDGAGPPGRSSRGCSSPWWISPPPLGSGSLGSHRHGVCTGRTRDMQIPKGLVQVLLRGQDSFCAYPPPQLILGRLLGVHDPPRWLLRALLLLLRQLSEEAKKRPAPSRATPRSANRRPGRGKRRRPAEAGWPGCWLRRPPPWITDESEAQGW